LRILGFDVAVFAYTVVAGLADGHGHSDLDLQGAVGAATSPAGSAMVAERENSKTLVAQLAVVLVLFLQFLRNQLIVGLRGYRRTVILQISLDTTGYQLLHCGDSRIANMGILCCF